MLQKFACTPSLLLAGVSAAPSPPSTPEDAGYLAALVETTYCLTNKFTASGLKVANSTLIESVPYSRQYTQRIDIFSDPAYGIVAAYKDTNNTDWTDFLHDMNFVHSSPDDSLDLTRNAQVHHGFHTQHRDVWPGVKAAVKPALDNYLGTKVTVIGHSMGAPIRQLGALDLQSEFGNVERVIAYAPPRTVGVWNGQDWVPWIISREPGYLHPDNFIWINPENGTGYKYFENPEDPSGPADKIPKFVTKDSFSGGISQLIHTIMKEDLYGAIAPIFDLLYWGGHEGIYFGTELYAAAARNYDWGDAQVRWGAHTITNYNHRN